MDKPTLLQIEDGQLLWLNPATNAYEFVKESFQPEEGQNFITDCTTSSSNTYELIQENFQSEHDEYFTTGCATSHIPGTSYHKGFIENLEEKNNKLWNEEETLLLISLVKKYNNELERGVKKFVWKKISQEIFEVTDKQLSIQQVETKWKGLVRYYKEITKWNNTSGNSKKDWKFFKVVNEILFKRPEINAEATCDSHTGLVVKTTTGMVRANFNENPILSDESSDIENNNSLESSFSRKRKQRESEASKRHNEKMQKLDRLADIMDQLVNVVQTTKKS